jgi:CheY-like chemotaxis protein
MMTDLRRILLAEDKEKDVELTLAALAEHRLADEVVVVRDGAEALDYLYPRGNYQLSANGTPAVILLDLKMPKVDGLGVLRSVRGDARLKHIPLVMPTSSREETDVIESYDLGVNAYVVKPVNFKDFVEAVKTLGAFRALINEPSPQPM